MVGKRGWLRIFEATIAILLVASVLLIMYAQNTAQEDITDYVYQMQMEVLKEISLNGDYRIIVLSLGEDEKNSDALNEFARTKIPPAFDFELKVCVLGEPCTLSRDNVVATLDTDVYVEDVVIGGDLGYIGDFSPKKVRLFVWESVD